VGQRLLTFYVSATNRDPILHTTIPLANFPTKLFTVRVHRNAQTLAHRYELVAFLFKAPDDFFLTIYGALVCIML
jgi:hypothetical protein